MSGAVRESVASLIAGLKESLSLEIRSDAQSVDHLEAVLQREELEKCCDALHKALGPPIKDFGSKVKFDKATQGVINELGGILDDQCLFLMGDVRQEVAYVALWPWASDPKRVTLKLGIFKVNE